MSSRFPERLPLKDKKWQFEVFIEGYPHADEQSCLDFSTNSRRTVLHAQILGEG